MTRFRKSDIRIVPLGGVLLFASLYMPLGVFAAEQNKGENSSWHWKMGAEERIRAEYLSDFDLNENAKDNGSQFYHRLRLNATATLTDEYLNEKVVFFAEGLDAQTGGHQLKPPAG